MGAVVIGIPATIITGTYLGSAIMGDYGLIDRVQSVWENNADRSVRSLVESVLSFDWLLFFSWDTVVIIGVTVASLLFLMGDYQGEDFDAFARGVTWMSFIGAVLYHIFIVH